MSLTYVLNAESTIVFSFTKGGARAPSDTSIETLPL